MGVVELEFKVDDTNLNLKGSVTFRRDTSFSRLYIRGMSEWRHVPANIIHVSEDTIQLLQLPEHSAKFAKIGLNWIGIKSRSNLMISASVRTGKNGLKRVQEQLTKFFKTIGATSVKFEVIPMEQSNESDTGDDD